MEHFCTVHPAQVSHHVCDGAARVSVRTLQQFTVLTPSHCSLKTLTEFLPTYVCKL